MYGGVRCRASPFAAPRIVAEMGRKKSEHATEHLAGALSRHCRDPEKQRAFAERICGNEEIGFLLERHACDLLENSSGVSGESCHHDGEESVEAAHAIGDIAVFRGETQRIVEK